MTKKKFIESLQPLVNAMKDARGTIDTYNENNANSEYGCMMSPATLTNPLTLFHFPKSIEYECTIGYEKNNNVYYAYFQVDWVWFEVSGKSLEDIFIEC